MFVDVCLLFMRSCAAQLLVWSIALLQLTYCCRWFWPEKIRPLGKPCSFRVHNSAEFVVVAIVSALKRKRIADGRTTIFRCLLLVLLLSWAEQAALAQKPGILVPSGFAIEHYADDDLAHDIYSLTIDAKGRVVVSGPGYVRILIDSDNDGKADTYKQFADGPQTGAQGMHFLGPHLLCSGDEGLLIYRDDNGDDQADGPPTTILKIAAGGEHHVHSIQPGPDGWWYVIAGNLSGVDSGYAKLSTSPIKNPEAGVLMRLKPDLSEGEVVSDGFRNAYDFAFNSAGDVFTFDSDGERDVSLPWYLPCRVFNVTPRSNAGWVSRSWKRPNYFPDMPPVVADFGRGSPTGVACYRHTHFPSRYDGSLFVLDWTFGRLLNISMEEKDGHWKGEPSVFAKATGNFGFAPTDIEVAADGSLYVSVGGRGTRGSVFRFTYPENAGRPTVALPDDAADAEKLNFVLNADQPLSSWSLANWRPVARSIGREPFIAAAIDEGRRSTQRVRAIEVLTSLFDGINVDIAERLAKARSAPVRARTAWAIGRSNPTSPDVNALLILLDDSNPLVSRFALEALTTVQDQQVLDKCVPLIAVSLGSANRTLRAAAASVVERLTVEQRQAVEQLAEANLQARIWLQLGATARTSSADLHSAKVALEAARDSSLTEEDQCDAWRLFQLALGDVGPRASVPAGLESYTARGDLQLAGLPLEEARTVLAAAFPSSDWNLNAELIRTIAILGSTDRLLIDKILGTITSDSAPPDDIHRLVAISRIQTPRTQQQSAATARALVNLDVKIRRQQLMQDSNWDDRLTEIYDALCNVDPLIPNNIGGQSEFGLPGHVIFMRRIGPDKTQQAIDGFVTRINADPDYDWSPEVVAVLGLSGRVEHQELIRGQMQNLSVQDAVLKVISEKPRPEDRRVFLAGIESAKPGTIEASLNALMKLPRNAEAAEQFALLAAAKRLNHDRNEFQLREMAIRLLQNNLSQGFAFVFGEAGHMPQAEALARWTEFLTVRYPDYVPHVAGGQNTVEVLAMLEGVAWSMGDVSRGKTLFTKLSCARCHGGRKALGPDLQGVSKRFTRSDLFASIVDPNRDVSSRYQLTSVETKSGKTYSGLVVYESVDGIILRDAEHNTFRVEAADIEAKVLKRASLMPDGLLKNVTAEDLADLNAYIESL